MRSTEADTAWSVRSQQTKGAAPTGALAYAELRYAQTTRTTALTTRVGGKHGH